MVTEHLQNIVKQWLAPKLAVPIHMLHFQPVGGGSINEAFRISVNHNNAFYFLKVNKATRFPALFEKEQKALRYLQQQAVIKVPEAIACDIAGDYQLLLLEWIPGGERTDAFWKTFGEQLAALHHCSAGAFGWIEDNYMGSIAQPNPAYDNWVPFFVEQRLQPLAERCQQGGYLTPAHMARFEKFYTQLPNLFNNEPPALLHGDLWSGNYMCNAASQPVLIDPAVYYGHRSMDMGMTTLFGGFRPSFYEAYHYHYPLPANYEEQWRVCNLYPLLIHVVLFGSGYVAAINETLKAFE